MALTSSRTVASKKATMTVEELHKLFKTTKELPPIRGFKLGVASKEDGGKTHFSLTPKGDIYFIDIESESRTVVEKFPDDVKDRLYIFDVVEMMKERKKAMTSDDILNEVENIISTLKDYAIANPDIKATIVIDSDTNLWARYNNWLTEQTDLVRSKNTGKMIRTEYGRINKRHSELRDNLRMTGWNVIITGRSYPSYDNSGGIIPDVYNPRWQGEIPGWVDVWGELKMMNGKRTFIIKRCRYDHTLAGLTVEEPTYEKVKDFFCARTGMTIV